MRLKLCRTLPIPVAHAARAFHDPPARHIVAPALPSHPLRGYAVRVMVTKAAHDSLARLRGELANLGRHWDLSAASDTKAALAGMEETRVDVLVARLGLSDPDGIQLLRLVRLQHPEVIRLALTDEGDRATAIRAMDVAHQCVSNPCDPPRLIETIERTVAVRHLLDSPQLRRIIGQVDRLPSAPRMYMQLRSILGDSECDTRSVCDLLDQDPALTGKVLQVANSALFSGGAAIHSVQQALMRIGLETLRIVVLTNEVFDAHRSGALAALRKRAMKASQLAARMAPPHERELARTAALLAEVGMLVPGVEALCAAEAGRSDSPPSPVEVGAYLLGLWNLPLGIVEAVAHHRQPLRVSQTHFGVLGIVHVATALSRGEAPDADYVSAMGMTDRVALWTRRAADLDDVEDEA